jgi:hypothetical protein
MNMASRKEIITGNGVLSGQGRKRTCKFRVTRTSLMVDDLSTPIDVAYSSLSIIDSDDFPDGDYELDFLGMKELLTRKGGHYLARHR